MEFIQRGRAEGIRNQEAIFDSYFQSNLESNFFLQVQLSMVYKHSLKPNLFFVLFLETGPHIAQTGQR